MKGQILHVQDENCLHCKGKLAFDERLQALYCPNKACILHVDPKTIVFEEARSFYEEDDDEMS